MEKGRLEVGTICEGRATKGGAFHGPAGNPSGAEADVCAFGGGAFDSRVYGVSAADAAATDVSVYDAQARYERQCLCESIEAFVPSNEQEAADKEVILRALRTDPNVFNRSAQAHMACSIWVVDPMFTQTLMVYHNIYDSWSWIGGHADGETDLTAVALRELEEETGVADAQLLLDGRIFSLEVLTVNGHEKRGAYVSSHLHLNITYLAQANPQTASLCIKPDENSGVRWVPLDQACAVSTEPWIRDRIYAKLIEKTLQVSAV